MARLHNAAIEKHIPLYRRMQSATQNGPGRDLKRFVESTTGGSNLREALAAVSQARQCVLVWPRGGTDAGRDRLRAGRGPRPHRRRDAARRGGQEAAASVARVHRQPGVRRVQAAVAARVGARHAVRCEVVATAGGRIFVLTVKAARRIAKSKAAAGLSR